MNNLTRRMLANAKLKSDEDFQTFFDKYERKQRLRPTIKIIDHIKEEGRLNQKSTIYDRQALYTSNNKKVISLKRGPPQSLTDNQ